MTYLGNYYRILNFGYYLGYFPYHYSKRKNAVLFNPSRKIYKRMIVSICMVILYELFMVFRAAQVQMGENISPVEKIRSMSITVIYILFNFNHIITLKNYGSHHICINEFLRITNQIKENAGADARRPDKKTKRTGQFQSVFCAVALTVIFLVAIARALRVFSNPGSREMLTSVVNDPKLLPIWIKIPVALLHWHLALFHAYFMIVNGTTFCSFSTAMVTTIHQTRNDENSNSNSSGGEMSDSGMRTIYKNHIKLTVLQSFFTSIYGIWPLGFEVAILYYSIIHLVLGVVFQNARYGILGVVSAMAMLSLFSSFAELHALSEEAIGDWKIGMRDSSWFAKFHRSCQPLKIHIGNFFYADRTLVLTIISIIVDNVTSLIISYKDTH